MPDGLFYIPAVIPLQRAWATSVAYARANFGVRMSAFSITRQCLRWWNPTLKHRLLELQPGATPSVTIVVVAFFDFSAKRRSKLTLKPFSCNCSMCDGDVLPRRRHRKFSLAHQGIPPFPCRQPSAIRPGNSRNARWRRNNASRTRGNAATCEAAFATS